MRDALKAAQVSFLSSFHSSNSVDPSHNIEHSDLTDDGL